MVNNAAAETLRTVELDWGTDIASRIEVRKPYLALLNPRGNSAGEVSAEVVPEQPVYNEAGTLSSAEAGRHMAILGSCSLAAINPKPGQHYYLARNAKFHGHVGCIADLAHQRYGISAEPLHLDRKTGSAKTRLLTLEGQLVFEMTTTYQVMTARLFARLFAVHQHTMDISEQSPYRRTLPLSQPKIDGDTLLCSTLGISAKYCEGHFEHHACIPVAVLMQCLSRAAGTLLTNIAQDPKAAFQVESASIDAANLAFPDEPIEFTAELLETENERFHFLCVATANQSRTLGTLDIWLTHTNPS